MLSAAAGLCCEKKRKASVSRMGLWTLLVISCSQRVCESAGFGLDATESSVRVLRCCWTVSPSVHSAEVLRRKVYFPHFKREWFLIYQQVDCLSSTCWVSTCFSLYHAESTSMEWKHTQHLAKLLLHNHHSRKNQWVIEFDVKLRFLFSSLMLLGITCWSFKEGIQPKWLSSFLSLLCRMCSLIYEIVFV